MVLVSISGGDCGVIGTSVAVTVTTAGFLYSTSGESRFCISNMSGVYLGSPGKSANFFSRRFRIILRRKKAPTREATRTIAMAIPAIAPVPMPEEVLFGVLIIVVLLELGFEGLLPVVLVDEMATI